jgi:hypothetical protein
MARNLLMKSFMKHIIFLFTILLFSQNIFAAENLDPESLNVAQSETASYGKFCKNPSSISHGRVTCLMTHAMAEEFCGRHKERLPTVRDAARWAVRRGIADIRHTAFVQTSVKDPQVASEIERFKDEGFQAITVENDRSIEVVDFYYNAQAFKNYVVGNEGHGFWTSTQAPLGWSNNRLGYIMVGFESDIIRSLNFQIKTEDFQTALAPVRCISAN